MQKMMGMFPATIPLLSLLPSRWFCFRFSSEICVDAWLDKCKVSFHSSRPRLTWYFENVKLNTLMLGDISKEIQTYSGKIFENFPTKKVSLHQTHFISLFRDWWKSVHLNDDFFSSHLYRVSQNLGFWKYHPLWISFETFIISKVFIISSQSHQACSRWYYSIWPRLGQEKGCLGNASQIYLISPTFRKLLRTDLHRKTLFSAFWFPWMIKQSKILLSFFSPNKLINMKT